MTRMTRLRRTAALALAIGLGGGPMVGSAEAQRPGERVRAMRFVEQAAGPQIGLAVREVTPADVERESLVSSRGAVVSAVTDGSPADEAGVRAGDVVVAFDGETVRSARQLSRLVQETPPGRAAGITVRRDGARLELEVTPVNRPASADDFRGPLDRIGRLGEELGRRFEGFRIPEFDVFRSRTRLGIGAQALTPQLADYFGVEEGVVVMHVEEDSAASTAGLRAGDVITAVDDRGVSDVDELRRRLDRVEPDEEFPLTITRDGETLTLSATVESRDGRRSRRPVRRPIDS